MVEEKGWFTYDHVKQWERQTGREVNSVGAVADMLTDFLYKMKGVVYEGVSDQDAKTRTIEGKQALLKGLTMGNVKRIADSVDGTDGLSDAIYALRKGHVTQVGFSDGLAPFVAYKMSQKDVAVGGVVPALVELPDGQVWFDKTNYLDMLAGNAVLLGKAGSFKKAEAIKHYQDSCGLTRDRTIAVDDSAANIETLARINQEGGLGIAFNPNDGEAFQKAGIPILNTRGSIFPIANIANDRRKLNAYREMGWII